MKKTYEAVEMNIVFFDDIKVICASEEDVFVPSYTQSDNETEIM